MEPAPIIALLFVCFSASVAIAGNPHNPCDEEKVVGPCAGKFLRWYFDIIENRCREFWYGGCRKNNNHFYSLEECQETCKSSNRPIITVRDHRTFTIETILTNPCRLMPQTGNCTARLLRWYFNMFDNSCHKFLYTGCYGNGNNFNSQEQCERTCIREFSIEFETEIEIFGNDVCAYPLEFGFCNDQQPSWYYSEEDNECMQFLYSGCGGNPNRFSDERSCVRRCVKGIR
ncbi:unnamed protein product [Soboliphyme baturini]|uniref:BPTI/Kunitz inhibitor domain-containing protein n=1 Tax=Soboliphyme baturini TaxID=241478 RepID=A0A183IQN5_9BILA|nr:unnamed protein product [Soboliphyme baturini]